MRSPARPTRIGSRPTPRSPTRPGGHPRLPAPPDPTTLYTCRVLRPSPGPQACVPHALAELVPPGRIVQRFVEFAGACVVAAGVRRHGEGLTEQFPEVPLQFDGTTDMN